MLSDTSEEGKETMEVSNRYFTELEQMVRAISLPHLEKVLRLLEEAYLNRHRIFIMGNGGRGVKFVTR